MLSRLSATVVALSALIALAACSEKPQEPRSVAARAVPVIAEPLRYEYARTRVEAVGTSRARLSAEIFPATAGEVVAVNIEPGQFVKVGVSFFALAAYGLHCLGVGISRIGCLTVVAQQWAHALHCDLDLWKIGHCVVSG